MCNFDNGALLIDWQFCGMNIKVNWTMGNVIKIWFPECCAFTRWILKIIKPVTLLHRFLAHSIHFNIIATIWYLYLIIYILMSWVFTPCSVVGRYGYFLGTCVLRLQDYNIRFSYTCHCLYPSVPKKEQHVRYLSTRPYRVPTQKTFEKSHHANLKIMWIITQRQIFCKLYLSYTISKILGVAMFCNCWITNNT